MTDLEFLLVIVALQWACYGVLFYGRNKGWKWIYWAPKWYRS